MGVELLNPPRPHWDSVTLSRLYKAIASEERPEDTVWFWEGASPVGENLFTRYFSSPGIALFLPVSDGQILGMMWVDHLVIGHKGHGHMYFFRSVRRDRSVDLRTIGRMSAYQIGATLNIRSLYFFIAANNKALVNYARKAGVVYSGVLPEYFKHGHAYVDAYVGHLAVGVRDGNQSIFESAQAY